MKNDKNINKKNNFIFKILGSCFSIICLLSLGIFSLILFKFNIVPLRYIAIIYVILLIILGIIILTLYMCKNYIIKTIMMVILLIFSVGFIFGRTYLAEAYNFLHGMQTEKYGNTLYSVIVLKENNYKEFSDLKNKKISYMQDEGATEIEKQIDFTYERSYGENFGELASSLLSKEIDAIILDDNYYNLAKENIEEFEEKTEVIYTFKVEVENKVIADEKPDEVNISTDPFILYISGIDQYGNVNSVRGRSDINILAVVNPKTNKILLVNTPRDYYVQLHNTTGLKDKLTHAGIYGIDMSTDTLEDLYDIDITYYLRVNFNTLIKVVDEIGGIDIESDKAFRAWTNKKVYIQKGWNHFNGEQALAYSRERYSYATGDRHRGQNQQQVISAIIDKVTTSEVLIKNYSNILNTLSNTFQTSMDVDTITGFLRYQLDKMPKWTVESISVTGADSSNYTHSMGSKYKLYVMEPNQDSINTAKDRITEVLNED